MPDFYFNFDFVGMTFILLPQIRKTSYQAYALWL